MRKRQRHVRETHGPSQGKFLQVPLPKSGEHVPTTYGRKNLDGTTCTSTCSDSFNYVGSIVNVAICFPSLKKTAALSLSDTQTVSAYATADIYQMSLLSLTDLFVFCPAFQCRGPLPCCLLPPYPSLSRPLHRRPHQNRSCYPYSSIALGLLLGLPSAHICEAKKRYKEGPMKGTPVIYTYKRYSSGVQVAPRWCM